MIFNYLPIDRIYYGMDSTKELSELISGLKVKKVLVMTSGSVSRTRFYKRLLKDIPVEYAEFPEITQHSPIEEIEHATEALRNHQCDLILTVGGGSVTDAGKAVRYYYDLSIQHVAIPTTLSAAEFSHIAGYTLGGEKTGIRDRRITPSYVFLDPRATMETPDTLWRSSGIRSLDHAVETLVTNPGSEIARQFSILAIKKLLNNLEYGDPESRYECLLAAWYSYFEVFDAPMGLSHNIGKVIGAKWEIPHGITSCITLPQIMKMYAIEHPEILAGVSEALGFSAESQKQAAERLARHVEAFIERLGLTKRLTDYGISETDLDPIIGKLRGEPDKLRKLLTSMF